MTRNHANPMEMKAAELLCWLKAGAAEADIREMPDTVVARLFDKKIVSLPQTRAYWERHFMYEKICDTKAEHETNRESGISDGRETPHSSVEARNVVISGLCEPDHEQARSALRLMKDQARVVDESKLAEHLGVCDMVRIGTIYQRLDNYLAESEDVQIAAGGRVLHETNRVLRCMNVGGRE